MSYLLSIELREGDEKLSAPGEVVLLAQCWCRDLPGVLHEYDVANGLIGKRFLDQIESAFRAGLGRHPGSGLPEASIAADPRRERSPDV